MTRLPLLILLPLLCGLAPTGAPAPTSRFAAVDILIDPHGHPLAAYQFEFTAEPGTISLVGVEAGEHPAYAARPPYYDPAALAGRRIIVADYSLAPTLPTTKTRIARLMLELRGDAKPQYITKLIAAADPDGKSIAVTLSIAEQ